MSSYSFKRSIPVCLCLGLSKNLVFRENLEIIFDKLDYDKAKAISCSFFDSDKEYVIEILYGLGFFSEIDINFLLIVLF